MVAGSEPTDRCTTGAMRSRRKIASLAALGAALLLSACEVPSDQPLTYQPPAADATMTVGLGADTLGNSVAAVSQRLSKAGVSVQIQRLDPCSRQEHGISGLRADHAKISGYDSAVRRKF